MMDLESSLQKVKNVVVQSPRFCYEHVVSSTAQLATVTPVYAALETMSYGMDNTVSLDARLNAAIATYCGVGFLVNKGRSLYRHALGISQSTSDRLQSLHDSIYLAGFSIPYSLILYSVSGETDWHKIGLGMGVGAVISLAIGPALGYAMDAGADVAGQKKCTRPSYVNQFGTLSDGAKKVLAAFVFGASMGLTALTYSVAPHIGNVKSAVEQSFEQADILDVESLGGNEDE
jgi:hypothetical protein